ncbi:MAG: glycosyltransferase family 1 protein [Candidatus Pacearchaeota archaeon]
MKKIGIDVRMIQHSGIGVRIQNILKYLPKQSSEFEFILFGNKSQLEKYPFTSDYPIIDYNANIYSISEFLGHPKMKDMDLLDIPHFNIPIKYFRKCVVTVHDLTPYVMREYFPQISKRIYLQVIFRLLKKVKEIITVSEYTKKDLLKEFRYNQEKIKVIYNGLNSEVFYPRSQDEVNEFRKKYFLPEEFFLCVGIGKEHKNFGFIIRIMNKLWKSGEFQTPLAIAGTNGKLPDFLEEPAREAGEKLILIPPLQYEELPLLYQSAKALIFPSLYEGFGFPLVEAQAVGCPVISSNTTVMPEILEDSALLFDPRKRESFLLALNLFLSPTSPRKSLIEAGFKNVQRFRWEKSVEEILNVYRSVL